MESVKINDSCTTILVGKKASYDGSTIIVRSCDDPAGKFTPKRFEVVKPANQPTKYKAVYSKCEVDLPNDPLQYTSLPCSTRENGIWGSAGFNSKNVGMSSTETITSNALVQGADPLVETGLGEEDFFTITIPYIHCAKDGPKKLGEYLEKYGTYEMNGIAFNDENDIWYIETIGGHHWIAKRVPEDCYAVIPNQQGIDVFDFVDAFGEQKDHMCSKDMIDFIVNNHLSDKTKEELAKCTNFRMRNAVGSHTDFDISYNTCRAWFTLRYFNPSEKEKFQIDDFNLPWCKVPDNKITIQDIKYVMSSYFNNTKYNPYLKYGDGSEKGKYRYIGINRTAETGMLQIRGYMPDKLKCVKWVSLGSNAFNAFVPQYAQVDTTPEYLFNSTHDCNTNNFYWTNRLIACITDSHYTTCNVPVEQYQLRVLGKSFELLNKFDAKFKEKEFDLKEANQEISDYFQKETQGLLNKVLFIASCEMKNAFSRSDA